MGRLFLIVFWLLIMLAPLTVMAGSIGFSGDWRYQKWSSELEKSWSFRENYSLNFRRELTDTMSLAGSGRYAKQRTPDRTLQQISPTLTFSLNNDLFSFNLSGTSNRRIDSDGPDYTTNTWDATLYSNWGEKWPAIRLAYGRSYNYDDQHPHQVDNRSNHRDLTLNYSLFIFDLYYSYRDSKDEDLVSDSTTWSYDQFGKVEANKSLFNNRLSLSASQQFSCNRTETETKAHGGVALVPVPVAMGYSGVDDSPDSGTLASNSALVDGDRFTSAGVEIGNTDDQNLGLETDYKEVNLVYVYTVDDVASSWVSQFKWDLYKSDDGNDWDLVSSSLSFSYNHTMRRFEVKFPTVSAKYVKLYVAQNPGSGDVYVTEMEAYHEIQTGQGKVTTISRFRSYRTDFNLGWRPWDKVSLSYSFSRNRSMPDPGPDTTDISNSGNISWNLSRYFSPTLSVSETKNKREGEKENKGRTYSLTATSSPLATLNISGGVSRAESYEGGEKESRSDTYNLYLTALLYPDLNASLDLVRTTSKDYREGEETRSFTGKLTTTARLSPKLTLDATGEYSRTSGEETTTSKRLGLSATWRVSDILLLRTNQSWSWEEENNSYGSSYTLWMAPTSKIQFNVQYSYSSSGGGDETHTYTTFASWAISSHFSLKTNYSYQKAGDSKSWNFGVQLTARF